ncbi:MAG: fasciclin domain-containing protein, partial [Pseudonocardiaceae bacterium]
MRKIQRLAAAGALAALTAVVGACSNSQGPATSGQPSSEAPQSSAQAAPNAAAPAPTGSGVTKISDIFGPACSQVPTEGPGSAQGMVNDPVATAASHNPLLTTLTKAVT